MTQSLSPKRSLPNLFGTAWWMLFLHLLGTGSIMSHNLDMQINYLAFDSATIQMVQQRAAAGQPLMRAGDIVGVILKATPNAGTKTGAGGYSTFFVPVGSQIVGAEYGVLRDNGNFEPRPMKGQSILTHGRDPADPGAPNELRGYVVGPNILGVSAQMAENTSAGFCWGTLAGLYADTGIFYSTDPATAWQSWVNNGGFDGNPATTADNQLRNNKGDYVTPTTLWDAHQLLAFGVKAPISPILDRNGRGATPWGSGTPVAGPESGYAWSFNKSYWDANPTNPNRMRNSIQVGPWKRLRYPGSEASKDTPGRSSSQLGIVGVDASSFGVAVSPSNPLPPTNSWTDTTSPKALRFSWGGLELYRPEFCRIMVKILKNPGESGAPFDPNGYLQLFGETFGGDAGGEYGNKDHVWRYYKPSTIGLSASPMIDMIASKRIVLPNELFHFDIRVTNLGNLPMTNAILENPLPSTLAFVSATPVQSAGPSALRWNLGTVPAQSTRSVRLFVRANSTGLITNKATIRSNEFPTPKEASDTVTSDFIAIMHGTKTVTPTSAAPGQKVTYRIIVNNEGACPNRSPWAVREFLPDGFRFVRVVDQFINGARTSFGSSTSVITANTSNLNQPAFTINRALDVGKTLEIVFEAELSPSQAPGQYFNRYAVDYDDKVYATGLIAPVTVGGAKVGDLVYQDWNGNGSRDANEPGLANVQLQLWTDPNGDGNPADGVLVRGVTTDAQGAYSFGGTQAGNYVVQVSGGVPAGYVLTGDPEGAINGRARLSLVGNTDQLWVDFGYRPQGTLAISGLVYSDLGNDGAFTSGKDEPINGATVTAFFDANNNGIVDGPDISIASTTTASGGTYTLSNLAAGLNYVVRLTTPSAALTSFFNPYPYKPSSPAQLAVGNLTANATGRNFGLFANLPGSIGDQVFQDINRNGIFDEGDISLPQVTLRLYADANNNKMPDSGELFKTMETDRLGNYLFADVAEGHYVVEVDLTDSDIPSGLTLAPAYLPVTVLPEEDRLDIDFPLKRVLSLSVSPNGSALPGSRLTYSINANYPQVTQFGGVTVSDTLPPGTTYVAGSATAGGVFSSNTVTWNLGSTRAAVQNNLIPVISCVRNVRLEDSSVVEDTYINASSTSTNYANSTLRLRPSSSSSQRQAMIKFNVSSLPAGATIRSVSIGLRVSTAQSSQVVTLYPMNTDWIESAATWNDPNGSASGRWASGTTFSSSDFNSSQPLGSFTPNSTGYRTISSTALTNLVQNWIDNPSSNRGIALLVTGSSTAESVIFNSESTINNVPYMDIQYEYVAADACIVDSQGAAYWSRDSLLNGRWSKWNGGNFEAVTTSPALSADAEFIVGASSSKRDEKIVAAILEQSSNNIAGQMWDGTAWTNLPLNPLGRAQTTAETGVAVAYEQVSGDALLVWTDADRPSGQRLRFSVWNGTSWTTPASVTSYTGPEPSGLKLAANPNNDQMTLIIEAWDYSNHAIVWNGSSWNSSILLDSGVEDNNNIYDIAVAYENLTGRSMVLYGKNNQRNVYYRLWNGTSWTSEFTLAGPGSLRDVRRITAASDPGGNRIAVGVVTEDNDAWFSVWSGTSWSTAFVAETDLETRDADTVAVAFESQSGELLAAYSENNHNGVKFRTWTPAAGWSAEASALPLGNQANTLILQSDLNTNQIMLLVQDNNLDLVVTRWDGSKWIGYRELEDNTGESSKQPFIYLWDIYRRNPNPPETTAEGLVGPASIINNAQEVTVSVTLTASRNVDAIVPPDPSRILITGSGVTATKLSGPTPGPSTVGQRGTTYSWTYRINGGTAAAEVLFRWPEFTIGDATFPTTDSNSFIYAPVMSYQADISSSPSVSIITNQAGINLGSGLVLSNSVETPLVACLGDQVWVDFNLNGLRDTNEPGLAGVRVFVDQNDNRSFDPGERMSVTNADGSYLITGVSAGTYQVTLDISTLPLDFIATTATRLTISLAANQSSLICDYGVAPRPPQVAVGTIGGLVWVDLDSDGVLDDYEQGFTGVTTKLWSDTNANGVLDANESLVATTTSGADGRYRFENLFAGRYLVTNEPLAGTGVTLVSGHTPLTGVISVNLTPTSIPPAPPTSVTPTIRNVSKGNFNIPITGVQIRRAGITPINQSSSATGVTLVTTDTIELTQLNILDNGVAKSLAVVNRGGGIVRNVNVSPSTGSYGVVISGTFQSIASLGLDNFSKVAATTASNSDLNNYIADDLGEGLPDGNPEYDMMFDLPYNPDDYVVISERFGNSTARLTPLDATGNVIPGSHALQIGSPYDWNTGLASPYISSQPYWITVIKANTFGVSQPIHGFRVDTRGADLKFFGMSDTPFITNVGTSTTYLDANFGYNHTGVIGDFVFYDHNGNGVFEPNGPDGIAGNADDETGVNDATVHLYIDDDENGEYGIFDTLYGMTSTNASGLYQFTKLPPGKYIVKAEDQSVEAPPGSDNAGIVGHMLATTEEAMAVTLPPGGSFLNADYGFIEKALLLGHVFHDENSSTLRDPWEAGLPNITVRIFGTDYRGNAVDETTETNAEGAYNLYAAPGSYTLTYDAADPQLPAGLIVATTPMAYSITIVAGVELENFDFGRDHNGILGGRVFNDDNGNGTQNRGEDGIPDITIQLFNQAGTTLITTTTTDFLGNYRFTGLPNATYTLVVLQSSLPPGYGTTPTADPDAVKDGRSQPVVVGGTPNLSQIFGYRHQSATHQLTGVLFDDSGVGGGVFSNGVRDGTEPGMAGVNLRVDIDIDKDGTNDEYRVITTESTGTFITQGVPTGADVEMSIVSTSLPRRAYAPTVDPNGAVDGRADFTALTSSLSNLLFGYSLQPSTITGTVVLGDGNGLADPGEPPLSGVIIRTTYGGADDIIGTADDVIYSRFTNAAGVYTVTNLDPGNFQITQSVPFGYKPRADADGGNPINISLSIAPGGHATAQDFEDYQLPQIRGRVLVDSDRSGDLSVDDTPAQGVSVRVFRDVDGDGVLDAEDNLLTTVTTNAQGVYSYGPIVEPASFIVQQVVPDTMIAVTDADGPANGINHLAVAVDELDVNGRDFLNRPIPMTLGGVIFNDQNNNALHAGASETGLPGIVLALIDMANGQPIASTTTAADGSYRFSGLWPGSYQVRFTPPSTHPASGGTPIALDDNAIDDNNGLQPGGPFSVINSPAIEMAVNSESMTDGDTDPNTNLTVDFGLWTGLTLGDLVFNDSNNNGLRATTEAGISSVTLSLFDPGADNAFGGSGANADTLVATSTTNSSGVYSFRLFRAGRYYLRMTPPTNRPLASTNADTADNGQDDDSNAIQLGSAGNDIISPVILLTAGGEPGTSGNTNIENTIDFGLRACPTITVGPTSISASAVYMPYTQAFTASGGVAPRTFRIISGGLPNGLSLSNSGVLTGTVLDVPGNYWFRLEARDAQGCVGTRDYTLSVTCPNPVVTPTDTALPAAWHWQSYSQTFQATGVAAAYTWSRSSGSFPTGLSLNPNTGVLSGTITGAPGTYTFTIRATDPLGYCVTDKAYTLEVRALWDYADLNDTRVGSGFISGDTIADHRSRLADDGPRHSIRPGFLLGTTIDDENDSVNDTTASSDGTDEDGLTMPSSIVAGSSTNAVVTVTNTIGVTARVNMWIDWNGNGSFEDVGERFVNNSTVTGSRSYTVTVPIGAVLNRPLGVRVRLTSYSISNSIGVATDGEVEDYLLTVTCPTITTTPASLPVYYLGASMSQMLSASGGTAPYAWSVTSGSLPPGLTLTPGGLLSGTPSAVGTFNFTVRAADAYGCFTTRAYSVLVKGLSIGNLVFNDQNDNGLFDAGEPGVQGITVELYNPGADLAIGGSGTGTDVLISTTTTDASGAYRFNHLPVGSFYLKIAPTANLRVTGGRPVALDNSVNNDNNGSQPGGPNTALFSPVIALTPGLESTNDGDTDPDTDLSVDFGIWSGVGIGSTLWADGDSNGRIDPDENGIAGVRVELWRDVDGNVANGGEVFVAHTTSTLGGTYSFLGYPAGRYQIVIPNSNFETGGPLASAPFASPVRAYNDDQVDDDSNAIQALGGGTEARSPLITLAAGDEPIGSGLGGVTGEFGRGGDIDDGFPDENADMTIDMGFSAPGSIGVGNLVFIDENDNGKADAGEGVEGITVQLFYSGDDPETTPPLLSTITDAQGLYVFSIVWEGTFFIHLPKNQFGANGMLRATLPIEGTTTGDDDVGEKSLFNDEPWNIGVRSVDFTVAYGAAPTFANGETGFMSATDDLLDADSDLTIDIGLYRPVGMGNLVFFDVNENGTADTGEGLDGVTVELYHGNDVPGFDAPLMTTVTDLGGYYLFERMKRGIYKAHIPASEFAIGGPLHGAVSIGEGLAGDDDVGEDGIDAANPTLTGITSRLTSLFPGTAPTNADSETGMNPTMDDHLDAAIDLTVDFGFTNPVGIGNLVFIDYNGNGVYDPGEGAAGVRVELYRSGQILGEDSPIFAQTTDANGGYFFGALGGGDYFVHIPPTQFQAGGRLSGFVPLEFSSYGDDDAGQNGLPVQDPSQLGVSTNLVTVIADQAPTNDGIETGFNQTMDDLDDDNNDLTIDIGFSAPRTDRSGVGNLVYIDANGNGRYDGGEGAAGVLVQLFAAGADPQTAAPLNFLTTDTNGFYLFSDLDEGDYFIHIPASQFAAGGALQGYFSLPGSGADDGLDDNQDENGIDSASPQLTGISSAVFNLTLASEPTTDSGETGEAAYMDELADSNSDLTIDFGFSQSMSLGNLVFIDSNGNGRADTGEGIAGITVQLYRAEQIPGSTTPLATTSTDSLGRYGFSSLLPGAYIVHIPSSQFAEGAALADLVSLTGAPEGDDDTGENGLDEAQPQWFGVSSAPVVLVPGLAPAGLQETGLFGTEDDAIDTFADLTVDFGFAPRVTVGNLVFADLNGNGRFDPETEQGVDDVEVEIWNDNDPSAAIATTLTSDGGLYSFTVSPGRYFIRIPATEFQPGAALAWHESSKNDYQNAPVMDGDDDVGEDGLDSLQPSVDGVRTPAFDLLPGNAPDTANGETGHLADTDDEQDLNVNLTIDLGFTRRPLGVGNLVFRDSNSDNRFTPGVDTVLPGVPLRLFRAGDNPNTATPVDTTLSSVDGSYFLKTSEPGTYYIHVPATAFATGGVLQGANASADFGDDDGKDDNLDQNAIEAVNPAASGVFTTAFELAHGTEPVTATGSGGATTGSEIGFNASSDDIDDPHVDLTIDLGFVGGVTGNLVAVGNVVFIDANANGLYDDGEGVDGVWMLLYSATGTPGVNSHLASTHTQNGGRYLFSHLPAGQYLVHVAADNFKPYSYNGGTNYVAGPLHGLLSVPGTTTGDDDLGEDGIGVTNPEQIGITSAPVTLTVGGAPVFTGTETGAYLDMNAVHGDANVDLTIDFGFREPTAGAPLAQRTTNTLTLPGTTAPGDEETAANSEETSLAPETYAAWADDHALGNQAEPLDDADGDGLTNLLEYALGLDPVSGVDPRGSMSVEATSAGISAFYRRPATGHSDLRYDVQVSSLSSPAWQALSSAPSVTNGNDGLQTLRYSALDSLPALASGSGWVRLQVRLDREGDGTPEATAHTQPAGWLRQAVYTGHQSLAMPLLKPALYSGRALLAGADRLTLTSLSTANLADQFEAGRAYYLEVATGSAMGHRFEIDTAASQGSQIVLNLSAPSNTSTSLPADLEGARLHIRPHWTLPDLLPASVLTAGATEDTADRALFFDRASNQFHSRWLQTGTSPVWTADSASHAPAHLAPGDALLLQRRGTATWLTHTGLLRDHDFLFKIVSGSQFIAGGHPQAQSPRSLLLTSASGLIAGPSAAQADRLRLWTGDSQPGASGYQIFYLQQIAMGNRWVDQADATLRDASDDLLLRSGKGLFIQRLPGSPALLLRSPVP